MPDFTPPTKPIDFKPPTAPIAGPSVDNSQPQQSNIPPDWIRADGSIKGSGFLGMFDLPNGKVASEYSVADSEKLKDKNGNYLDYPSLVPTLTKDEVQAVLKSANSDGKIKLPDSVYQKAEAYALQRQKAGKPLFAQPGEENLNLYPELKRSSTKPFNNTQQQDNTTQPGFLDNHPLIRQVLQRASRGYADEDLQKYPELKTIQDPTSHSILPEAVHQPGEDAIIGNLKGMYNFLVRPLGSVSGLIGASSIGGEGGVTPEISAASKELPIKPEINAGAISEVPKGADIQLPAQGELNYDQPKQFQTPEVQQAAEITKTNPQVPAPRDKFLQMIKSAQPVRNTQESLYTAERGKRIAQAEAVTARGQEGFNQYLGALKGEMPKVEYSGAKLEPEEAEALKNEVLDAKNITSWERPRAMTGLTKILNGSEVPQDNELAVLRRVFGPEVDNIKTARGMGSMVVDALNAPKALAASMDLSAPFRQGAGLVHTKEYWQAWDDMIKSAGSENAFSALQESIRQSPHFPLAQESGLGLSDLHGSLNQREEQFMSKMVEKIPGVRASERGYVGFLNKVRSDVFGRLIEDAKAAGLDPENNLALSKEIAGYVNTATGRGNLGSLEKYAAGLNNAFFSPRFIKSRIDMLNPLTYINASPFVRKQYIKSALALGGLNSTVLSLAGAAGAEMTKDPTNADFGKAKFGNTRIDAGAGFQPYLTLLSRLASGETTSSTSGRTQELGAKFGSPTRANILEDFVANKLAPVPKFVYDWLNQSRYRNFNLPEHLIRSVAPMMIQDIYDVAKDNPALLPIAAPASGLGMGVQTYGK